MPTVTAGLPATVPALVAGPPGPAGAMAGYAAAKQLEECGMKKGCHPGQLQPHQLFHEVHGGAHLRDAKGTTAGQECMGMSHAGVQDV